MQREQEPDGDSTTAENVDDDLEMAPSGPETAAWDSAVQAQLDEDNQRPRFVPVEMPEEKLRFSVSQALFLTAFAAVMLGVLQFVRPDVLAGTLGLITFLGLVTLSVVKPKGDIFHVGWWVLLMVYLIISVVAAVRS